MATPKVMIDNKKTKVTLWSFEPGEDTGSHIHEYDYVIVPITNGELKIINSDGTITYTKLNKGISYFKEKGIEHNVINNNNYAFSFVEIEFKNNSST